MMCTFDKYCLMLLEESKRFLEKANDEKNTDGITAYLNASLFISTSSLEAFINSIISEFKVWAGFSIHERALLLEKSVKFEKGGYVIVEQLQMSRLKDKIELLLNRFRCKMDYRTTKWWAVLDSSLRLRNSITHPKEVMQLNKKQVEDALYSIIDCIDCLFITIYKKKFPIKGKALNSIYTF